MGEEVLVIGLGGWVERGGEGFIGNRVICGFNIIGFICTVFFRFLTLILEIGWNIYFVNMF